MKGNRRRFIQQSLTTAAGFATIPAMAKPLDMDSRPVVEVVRPRRLAKKEGSIRFSVIGLNHGHIYGQTEAVIRGGGELVSVYAKEPDLAQAFTKRFPQAKLVSSEKEILDDKSIHLVVSASIPVDRAPLGVR